VACSLEKGLWLILSFTQCDQMAQSDYIKQRIILSDFFFFFFFSFELLEGFSFDAILSIGLRGFATYHF
jgi:hypothetical protein